MTLLYVLTFWGTVAQVQNGLYAAQYRFFQSFFFLALGFIPFPGGQLVMWILFVNLVCVALTRFAYTWRNIGIIVIHLGLLLFLISGYITLHGARESYVHLEEGQASNLSTSYHDWEISIWEDKPTENPLVIDRDIVAVEMNGLETGKLINVDPYKFSLEVLEIYPNCSVDNSAQNTSVHSASGITGLKPLKLLSEPEKNTPGIIVKIQNSTMEAKSLLLYGDESKSLRISVNDKVFRMLLRRKRFELPLTLKLLDFKKEVHPGTDTARIFQSRIEITKDGVQREKLISMNEPLRYKDFTFYQSSYSVDKLGREASVLAVVKNRGRLLPYISTLVTFLGLVIHFAVAAFRSRKNDKKESQKNV